MLAYTAIVLAGGTGRRLGGVDKAEVEVGGSTLLTRALDATKSAAHTVVVGPVRDVPSGVGRVQENPPGGGPVPAVAAGLRELSLSDDDVVVVLACDMPFVDVRAVERLVSELADRPSIDGVLYADADGRAQSLAAAYRGTRLADAIAEADDAHGASMRSVLARLTIEEIAAHPDLTLDCDTWQDVERTRQIMEGR